MQVEKQNKEAIIHYKKTSIIKKEIERFKTEFDFVMIAEFFEQSMVLLAHSLCWPLEWVTGISQNVRKQESKVHINVFNKLL